MGGIVSREEGAKNTSEEVKGNAAMGGRQTGGISAGALKRMTPIKQITF